MVKPLVSVLMPVYNCLHFVEESLLSAPEQDCDNLEVVLADDSSSDGTADVVRKGEALVLYGDATSGRDLLYLADAVEASWRAAVSDSWELGPVNIGRGQSIPVRACRCCPFPGMPGLASLLRRARPALSRLAVPRLPESTPLLRRSEVL